MVTTAELLLRRADDDTPALLVGDEVWTYRDLVEQGARRAALHATLHDPRKPPHIGVLLENGPDYLFWLAGAALSGAVIVGINATYRGAELARLVEHSDCELLVTSSGLAPLLDDAGLDHPPRILVDAPEHAGTLREITPATPGDVEPEDPYLLIFTSGSTGAPKAVVCTQGRFARTGGHVAGIADLTRDDVTYLPSPFFHSSALFTGWASALHTGIPVATRPKFSASGTRDDFGRFGVTFMNYTGKILNYVLATPPRPDDSASPLRLVVGNEASVADIRAFADRFGCQVRDSYGSTEGLIIIRRDPSMPDGALGRAAPTVKVVDPDTAEERPPAVFDADGKVLNIEDATGEIVETEPASDFEGYYKNTDATESRTRNGWYWSGDLAYRDAEGWFYFAGRANDWLRVDGENFASAPVEAILGRHPDVRAVAVYAVPDEPVGDRVMAALELREGAGFDPTAFDAFLQAQPDLGPKWIPSFVRTTDELPKLASMKLNRNALRREAWRTPDVWWRPGKGEPLRPLDAPARTALDPLLP